MAAPERHDPTGPAPTRPAPLIVGVVSDTHGHLYPQVVNSLKGVDHIVHAGDVGSAEVLRTLRQIAPLTAVRGNVDMGSWADALPARAEVELGGVCIVVGHISPRADGAGRAGQPVVVVSGHSHIASEEWREGILHLNPGSAGPRRFGRPRTVARLEIWPALPEAAAHAEVSPREARSSLPVGRSAAAAPRVVVQIIPVAGD
jgi:putative phosphoesterase